MPMAQLEQESRDTTLQGKKFSLAGPQLKVGDPAPDFDVVSSSLQKVNLSATGGGVRIFSVLPSLDTPVCDAQTKRFQDEAEKLNPIKIFTVSMDLPFAQKRWCGDYGVNRVTMLSDHLSGSFGENYGTLIKDLRIESRAIFIVDRNDKIRYVEYVDEVGNHPNYDAVLKAAQEILKEDQSIGKTA